jgi:hypothetical protein
MHLEANASPAERFFPACRQTLLGGQVVDVALDVEEGVDAFERIGEIGAASTWAPGSGRSCRTSR